MAIFLSFQKTVIRPFICGLELRTLRNHYTSRWVKSQFCVAKKQKYRKILPAFFFSFLQYYFRTSKKGGTKLWIVTLTSALSAPFPSAHTTARTKTTALWSESWWAPTRLTPLWMHVPTANLFARSKPESGSFCCRFNSFSWRMSGKPVLC